MIRITRKRRTSYDIKAEILTAARTGVKKTSLMNTCNLSFSQVNEFLGELNHGGFLDTEEKNGGLILKTNEKGKKWLEAFQQLKAIK